MKKTALLAAALLFATGCSNKEKAAGVSGEDDNEVIVTVEASEEASESDIEIATAAPLPSEEETTSEEETAPAPEEGTLPVDETTEAATRASEPAEKATSAPSAHEPSEAGGNTFFKLRIGMSKEEAIAAVGTEPVVNTGGESCSNCEWYFDKDDCFGTGLPFTLYLEFSKEGLEMFGYAIGATNDGSNYDFPCGKEEVTAAFDKAIDVLEKEYGPCASSGAPGSTFDFDYTWKLDDGEVWAFCHTDDSNGSYAFIDYAAA